MRLLKPEIKVYILYAFILQRKLKSLKKYTFTELSMTARQKLAVL